jgi:acetylornithine deacetylase/succinyl-diaminopimelate desuccinylase-like protein
MEELMRAVDRRMDRTLSELRELARIPSVSAPGFDAAMVARSAGHVAGLLERAGLSRVEVLSIDGSHPYVVGERRRATPGAPSVLIYAHHDVQPPGRASHWETPAFEPTVRSDGRLYGRGVVDDKAGLLLNLAALHAWLDVEGESPVDVTFLVEGEEEIGSPHLEAFLRAHRERLRADVIVLSDTANLRTGLPSLTTSLRGLVAIDVTVRALDHPLHSGMWGGPVMDAATALARVLARLVDDAGVPKVPGLADDAPELSDAEREALAELPFDESELRADAALAPSVRLAGDARRSVYERLWMRPALAVTALEAVPLAEASNQLIDVARARVGVRLAPGQDPERVAHCVADWLRQDPPWGVAIETEIETAARGWRTEPHGPAFDAARRALRAGYACEPVHIGCGGTIPFVGPFCSVLDGAPALLLGLEDPICNAHSENESLHLGDFTKACRAATHLLRELSSLRSARDG